MTNKPVIETSGVNYCYATQNWIVTKLGGNIGYRAWGGDRGEKAKILLETRDFISPADSRRYYMTFEEAKAVRDALTAALEGTKQSACIPSDAKVTAEWDETIHECNELEEGITLFRSDRFGGPWGLSLDDSDLIVRIKYCPGCGKEPV